MRRAFLALLLLAASAMPAFAQVSLSINLGGYPTLQRIPGYPVYYAPAVNSNYFFYDGLYWVYDNDNWYESSWYNGPWRLVEPFDVPVFLLRVPVRYYRHAPAYFHGWRANEAPHWGEHWGRDWEQRRGDWNHWDHRSPAAAPLPTYQRQYHGNRYPSQATQQAELHNRNYNYQPREQVSHQRYEQHGNTRPQSTPQYQHDQGRTPQTEHGNERRGGTGQDQRG
ncbi:MAG: hypothetical protein ACXWBQ_07020 [Usitatibacter sp.]